MGRFCQNSFSEESAISNTKNNLALSSMSNIRTLRAVKSTIAETQHKKLKDTKNLRKLEKADFKCKETMGEIVKG